MLSVRIPQVSAEEAFDQVENFAVCPIDQYPWPENDFRPETEARIAYAPDQALFVQLASKEGAYQALRADCEYHNGDIYLDSCLEFFVDFAPGQEEGYLNFEFNPHGFLHLKLGRGRSNRREMDPGTFHRFLIEVDQDIDPVGQYDLGWWRVRFVIPDDFITDLYGESAVLEKGRSFKANFYKCGDATEFIHYAMWSPGSTENPDFHRPECFGRLILG